MNDFRIVGSEQGAGLATGNSGLLAGDTVRLQTKTKVCAKLKSLRQLHHIHIFKLIAGSFRINQLVDKALSC